LSSAPLEVEPIQARADVPSMTPLDESMATSYFSMMGFYSSPFPFVLQIAAIFLLLLTVELNLSMVLWDSTSVHYQEISGLSSIGCFLGVFIGFLRGSYRRFLLDTGTGGGNPSLVLGMSIVLFILLLIAVVYSIFQNFYIISALIILASLVPTTVGTAGLLLHHRGFFFFSIFIITFFFLLRRVPIDELEGLLVFSVIFLAQIEVGYSSIHYGELTQGLDSKSAQLKAHQRRILFRYLLSLVTVLLLAALATTLVFGITDLYREIASLSLSESLELSSVYAHLLVSLSIIGIGIILILIKRWRTPDTGHENVTPVMTPSTPGVR